MGISGEDRIFKFCVAVFVVLFTLKLVYGPTPLYGWLVFLVALTAVLLMIKGFFEILFYGEHSSFSSGGAVAVLIVLLFNGLPYLQSAAWFIVSLPLALLGGVGAVSPSIPVV